MSVLGLARRRAKEAVLGRSPGLFWRYVEARHGYLEPELALLSRLCLPEEAAVDIGANYGLYTYYMLKYSAKCVAFEPLPSLARLLRTGWGSRLEVHQAALSDRTGNATLFTTPEQPGYSTIEPSNPYRGKIDNPAGITELPVRVRRLDEFDLGPVAFIKIDVEGHEEEVLEGARETLARSRPTLLVEIEERHRAGSTHRIIGRLSEVGYSAFFLSRGHLVSASSFDPTLHQSPVNPREYIRNFVFLPHHRLQTLNDLLA